MEPREVAAWAGVVGGLLWVVKLFVTALETPLTWAGALLMTAALLQLGSMLVKRGVLALRAFVAVALPTLVWAVVLAVRPAVADGDVLDAVVGGLVALASLVLAFGAPTSRATL